MAEFRVKTFNAANEVTKDVTIDGEEEPGFYAHQYLHADGVTRVEVFHKDELIVNRSAE